MKAVAAVEKELNKEAESKLIQRLGDKVGKRLPSVPTGIISLDYDAIGCGGFPKGRVIEIYGPESSGKTTLALHVVGQVQKAGGVAAYVDAEHALDPTYASKLGVDVDNLFVSQPDCGEQALDVTEALVRSGGVDVVVVDSVAALVPRAELEGDFGDSHMGLQARLMSQAMRKLTALVSHTGCVVIFINQIREKIGVMFGNPETTTGGRGLKFAASVRIEIRRVSGDVGKILDEDKVLIGYRTRAKIVKNKVGPPFKETIYSCLFETGVDVRENLVEYAGKLGVVEMGAWCLFEGEKYRKKSLTESPVFEKIALEVDKHLNPEEK
jgi:recombination protein RecA